MITYNTITSPGAGTCISKVQVIIKILTRGTLIMVHFFGYPLNFFSTCLIVRYFGHYFLYQMQAQTAHKPLPPLSCIPNPLYPNNTLVAPYPVRLGIMQQKGSSLK